MIEESLGLFAVADGVGGHRAGEVASRIAVETLASSVRRGAGLSETAVSDLLEDAFRRADEEIRRLADSRGDYRGMARPSSPSSRLRAGRGSLTWGTAAPTSCAGAS